MAFVQNRRLSIFSHWIIIERPQNWPDLRSPISKFRDTRLIGFYTRFYRIHEIHCYSHQSLKVSRQSCGRCSHDEHSNLFLTPWETWVWNFHSMCGKDARTGVLKTAARSCEKPPGGGGVQTPPGPARVKIEQNKSTSELSTSRRVEWYTFFVCLSVLKSVGIKVYLSAQLK